MVFWQITVLLAYFVKGTVGFGNTPVHTALIAHRIPNSSITPIELLLTIPANLTLFARYHRQLERRIWLPAALLNLCGALPGALLLHSLDSSALKVICGFTIMLLGLDMLRSKKPTGGKSAAASWLLVALSGLVSGLFGIGAMLAAAFSRLIPDSEKLKANLSAVYVSDNLVRLLLYLFLGLLTPELAIQALKLCPAMGVGLFLGIRLSGRLNARLVRLAVVAVLLFSGAMLVIGNLSL